MSALARNEASLHTKRTKSLIDIIKLASPVNNNNKKKNKQKQTKNTTYMHTYTQTKDSKKKKSSTYFYTKLCKTQKNTKTANLNLLELPTSPLSREKKKGIGSVTCSTTPICKEQRCFYA